MSVINAVKLPDGTLGGLCEPDKVAYKRFKSRLKNLEVGELITFDVKLPRNSKYHRKFFAMLNLAYEMWEPNRKWKSYKGVAVQKNFERFRSDVLIQAGYYSQTFDLDGNMKLEPISISFAAMDDIAFERVYSSCLDVLLEKVLITYKDRAEVDAVIEKMMGFI